MPADRGNAAAPLTSDPQLTPTQIRLILDYLGLTPKQAGRLLGGGDKGFVRLTLPEDHPNHRKPTDTVTTLLLVAALRPSVIDCLRDRRGPNFDAMAQEVAYRRSRPVSPAPLSPRASFPGAVVGPERRE